MATFSPVLRFIPSLTLEKWPVPRVSPISYSSIIAWSMSESLTFSMTTCADGVEANLNLELVESEAVERWALGARRLAPIRPSQVVRRYGKWEITTAESEGQCSGRVVKHTRKDRSATFSTHRTFGGEGDALASAPLKGGPSRDVACLCGRCVCF